MIETTPHRRPIPARLSMTRKQKLRSMGYVWSTRAARDGVPSRARRPAGAMLAAGAVMLALAACQSEPAEPQAAAEPVAESPAPTQAAAGQPVVEERLSTADCATPAQGRVHFSINDVVFAVPGGDVRSVLPAGASPTTEPTQIVEMLRQQTAAGAGCPEKPLDARLLSIGGDFGDPLLGGEIGILGAAPGSITGPFEQTTRELQRNPNQSCKDANGGLLACIGTETVGERQTRVMILVTTDPDRKMATGGPLAVRCLLAENAVRGCNIVDELPGGIAIDAPLRPGTYSTESLAAAHAAAIGAVNAIRL